MTAQWSGLTFLCSVCMCVCVRACETKDTQAVVHAPQTNALLPSSGQKRSLTFESNQTQ